ncbi:MAG: tetratricopeptide repeat protein [Smithellaceae bacterium]|nr:tetratricopeptide repeat protein [Smithellaceae bacterium]
MPSKVLKIEQILPNEWRFCYRANEGKQIEKFMTATTLIDYGEHAQAEEILRSIIESCPGHLDARHCLAYLHLHKGRKEEALEIWREAVAIGMGAFPKKFVIGEGRLEWIWPENRSFLQAYAGLGTALHREGALKEALSIFSNLLSFNPGDHQGVRGIAIETAFALGRPDEVLRICEKYPGDILVDTLYARPLVLIQLGRREEAVKLLASATEQYPLVARDLLGRRHVRPRGSEPGFVEVGGADEAYEYWRRMGKNWKKTGGALDMLRQATSLHPSLV